MKKTSPDSRGSYAFGRYRLSADGTLLLRDGVRIALAPKVLQTLRVLVEHAGEVVKKADLLREVWPDSFVEETGLTRNISLLRQALADEDQTTIVTVARIGYRFSAPRRTTEVENAPPDARVRLLILPFRLIRDDPEIGFLAFSLSDAVTNALSGLQSLAVRSSAVASRFNTETLDLKQIATDADVDAVVTGTLLRSGERIRVTAQLLNVPCGTVLWSESLQATVREVFELQDQLVTHVVRSLSLSLTPRERHRLEKDVPSNPAAYEYFLRANEAVGPQGISNASNLRVARELYTRAVEEDPQFAPAWARLARCHYLIGKADGNRDENIARAESCFQRSLELSPDLPLAHSLYALLEIDQGRARSAMTRLVSQALEGIARPETYAALVQACRFCGLLEPSITAHERARALDSTAVTSGYQSLWQLGEEDRALREGAHPYVLRALATGMRGDPGRAIEMLRQLEERKLTSLLRSLSASQRAVYEGRHDVALETAIQVIDASSDPEAIYYVARNIAFFGDLRAIDALNRALDGGFVVYRVLLRHDPWLDPLRSNREFLALLDRSREAYRECLKAYEDAGAEHLLGAAPAPEKLERCTYRSAPSLS